MTSHKSSGSRRAESAGEPTRSQNMTVNSRRSAPDVGGFNVDLADSVAIALSSLRRRPMATTPSSLRSSAVRVGSTDQSIAFSAKAAMYCSRSSWRSQSAISTASPAFIVIATRDYPPETIAATAMPSVSRALPMTAPASIVIGARSGVGALPPPAARLKPSWNGRSLG
jgi:hypothetical protein